MTTHLRPLLFILACCTSTLLHAQSVQLGVQGGAGITKLYGNQYFKPGKPDPAATGGIYVQYNITRVIGINAGLNFATNSWRDATGIYDQNNNLVPATGHSRFYHLTIPVLFRTSLGNKTQFFFNAGIYAGFLLKATDVFKPDEQKTVIPVLIYDRSAEYKKFDAGVVAGCGVSIPIKESVRITVEARHNIGVLNIADFPIYPMGRVKTYNSVLVVGMAYVFGKRSHTPKTPKVVPFEAPRY